MISRLRIRTRAAADLLIIAERIAEHHPRAAERFVNMAEQDMLRLAEFPLLGSRRNTRIADLKEIRSLPVTHYRKYLIFYQPIDAGIEVIRILHGARRATRLLRET